LKLNFSATCIFASRRMVPSWSQRPERDDLFKLFLKASRYERLHADSMLGFMRDAWLPKRKELSEVAEAETYALGEAWGEWAYCKEMLDRGA
jgi:hypothetical protein